MPLNMAKTLKKKGNYTYIRKIASNIIMTSTITPAAIVPPMIAVVAEKIWKILSGMTVKFHKIKLKIKFILEEVDFSATSQG